MITISDKVEIARAWIQVISPHGPLAPSHLTPNSLSSRPSHGNHAPHVKICDFSVIKFLTYSNFFKWEQMKPFVTTIVLIY